MLNLFTAAACLAVHGGLAAAQLTSATAVASQFSLTTSTSMPFPTATLSNSDTQSFMVAGWSLSKGRIQNGADDLEFVADPFPSSPVPGTSASSGPVLQVTYPEGSFSHDTGGAQLFSLWNTTDGSKFNSVLLSYEVAFDSDFAFVKGGKLPGLRGGPDPNGCSGGSAANGTNCFSSRLMWRKSGEGEGMFAVSAMLLLCAHRTQYMHTYRLPATSAPTATSCVTRTDLVPVSTVGRSASFPDSESNVGVLPSAAN